MRCFAALVLVVACAAAETRPDYIPLATIPHATVFLRNGTSVTGTIEQVDADGTVHIRALGEDGVRRIPPSDLSRPPEMPRTAEQVVERRLRQALAADDRVATSETLRWGFENKAVAAALAGGRAALAKHPEWTDVAELLLPHLGADHAAIIALVRPSLAKDPRWERGYAPLLDALLATNQTDEALQVAEAWAATSVGAAKPRLMLAEAWERAGRLREAQDAWRKAWMIGKAIDAAVGYGRVALLRGEYADALAAAKVLLEAKTHETAANAVAGSALLGSGGDLEQAQQHLNAALAAPDLAEPLKTIVAYNIAVLHVRAGHTAEARRLWEASSAPEAVLALRLLDRQPYAGAPLPGPAQRVADELNTALLLEARQAPTVAPDVRAGARQRLLALVARGMQELPTPQDATLNELAKTPGAEAQRWLAWLHLAAGRFERAEAVLAQLPANDGWAAVYRVYAAAGRKEPARARELLAKALDAREPPAPAAYLQHLKLEYQSGENIRESFDWPPERIGAGWKLDLTGTGIQVAALSSRLVLQGTQAGTEPAVARLSVPGDRLRVISIAIDASAIGEVVVDEHRGALAEMVADFDEAVAAIVESLRHMRQGVADLAAVADVVVGELRLEAGRIDDRLQAVAAAAVVVAGRHAAWISRRLAGLVGVPFGGDLACRRVFHGAHDGLLRRAGGLGHARQQVAAGVGHGGLDGGGDAADRGP